MNGLNLTWLTDVIMKHAEFQEVDATAFKEVLYPGRIDLHVQISGSAAHRLSIRPREIPLRSWGNLNSRIIASVAGQWAATGSFNWNSNQFISEWWFITVKLNCVYLSIGWLELTDGVVDTSGTDYRTGCRHFLYGHTRKSSKIVEIDRP